MVASRSSRISGPINRPIKNGRHCRCMQMGGFGGALRRPRRDIWGTGCHSSDAWRQPLGDDDDSVWPVLQEIQQHFP